MTADNGTSVKPDGVEAWAGRCFCGGRLVRASGYGGHVVCAQLLASEEDDNDALPVGD